MSILTIDLNKGRKLNQLFNSNWSPFHADMVKSLHFLNNNLANAFKEECDIATKVAMPLEACLDIYENEANYEVILELPGVKKEDVKILATSDEQIEIKASKNPTLQAEENSKRQAIVQERSFGQMERTIVFEKKINKNSISAKWNNGELTIIAPKLVSEEPKEIAIDIE